ncbi:MAG: FecR family protein [Dongiaceae bacterium]
MSNPSSPARRAVAQGHIRHWLGLAVLAAALTMAGVARAEDNVLTWIVKSISSNEDGAYIRTSTMQAPQEGTALTSGQRISTTGGQRMVLTNGRDLVEIGQDTTVVIGDNDPATTKANVDVVSGAIHVEVGKRAPGQTFSIGAPYLIATVKGTKFDVGTTIDASTVSVTEGIVAVSAIATGNGIDVTAGNTATVSRLLPGVPTIAPTQPTGAAIPASTAPGKLDLDGNLEGANTGTGDKSDRSGGSSSEGPSSGGSGSGGGLGGAVGRTADAVGGAVSGATGVVGDAVGGGVGGAVSGVGGAVGGAVSGVGGALGGAVGRLGRSK